MKKISTQFVSFALLFFCFFLSKKSDAQTYDAQNVTLLGYFNDSSYVANNWVGSKYSGCWGWYNPADGKEYAIVGGSNGTYFIEVTNPATPVVCDYVPGIQVNCVWREYKTYQNYCYMVSDDPSPNGMQIADLSYLPDSVHIVHSGNSIMERCHTIFVDGNKLYGGSVGSSLVLNGYASMAVFSLANAAAPALLRTLNQDDPTISTVHDMFVRNDTVYASCGYAGLFMYKFNSNNTFSPLSSLTAYPFQGYNHASSLTDDGNTLIFMDEVPNQLPVKVLDVSNFSNPVVVSNFSSSIGDTPHNPFVIGNDYVVCANYQDGIQIYNISDPANPFRSGYFDTHWQTSICDTSFSYLGCWGAYPYLPSGIILAIDMQNGLYVLNGNASLGIHQNNPSFQNSASVYYNGSDDNFEIIISSSLKQKINFEIFDLSGRKVFSSENNFNAGISAPVRINAKRFARGAYVMTLKGENFNYVKKICKAE